MPKKLVPKDERKENFTIRLPNWLILKIRSHKGYTRIVEKILVDFFNNEK
ncbi:hypothetical protein [Brevibacillus sp. SYSU BS000544]